jgi:hypothetical protein
MLTQTISWDREEQEFSVPAPPPLASPPRGEGKERAADPKAIAETARFGALGFELSRTYMQRFGC